MSYQQHTLVGNVGSEPEIRAVGEGQNVANFSLAVNETFGDREVTTWYRVSVWNKLAEIVTEHLHKGRLIVVEGSRLRASAYVNQRGEAAATLELTANRIRFLGAKAGSSGEVPFEADEPPATPPAARSSAKTSKASSTRTSKRRTTRKPDDYDDPGF